MARRRTKTYRPRVGTVLAGGILVRIGSAVRALSLIVLATAACVSPSGTTTASPRSPSAGTAGTVAPPSVAIPTDAAGAPVRIVWMGDHYYSPSTLTIPVGTTVMWRMLGQQEHDVWAFDGSFHSPTMGPGSTFVHTFARVGTFRYLCIPHSGDGMYGEVIVVPRPAV